MYFNNFSIRVENEFLESQAIGQYLFRLLPNTSENNSLNNYRGVSSIGILDMSWRTTMGERGRLRTSPLQRMVFLTFYFLTNVKIQFD